MDKGLVRSFFAEIWGGFRWWLSLKLSMLAWAVMPEPQRTFWRAAYETTIHDIRAKVAMGEAPPTKEET
jgi:hypothetical protein